MNTEKQRTIHPDLVLTYLMTVAVMFALKQFYSNASADELVWVLKPVAWLVGCFGALPYTWVPDTGFVRADHMITIAPACAGVNFMIMAMGLPVAAFAHRTRSPGRGFMLWCGALLGACALTVAVNALRIIVAIAFYDAQIAWGWFTPDRLHRLMGVGVYFTALGLYYALWQRIMAGNEAGNALRRLWPWMWYVTGAIAVPVLHRMYQGKPWPGMEYCLTVIGTSAFIFGLARVASYLIQQNRKPGISQCIQRSSS